MTVEKLEADLAVMEREWFTADGEMIHNFLPFVERERQRAYYAATLKALNDAKAACADEEVSSAADY